MTNKNIIFTICVFTSAICHLPSATAGPLSLSGYGTGGGIWTDVNDTRFLGDWRLRGQMAHDFGRTKIGAVYAIDQIAIDANKYSRDAFGFAEFNGVGRVELGLTDSVARKLGVGLPDVGGMRVNEQPLFWGQIKPRSAIISDTVLDSGRYSPRLNLATAQIGNMQYGASVSASDTYDYNIDLGLKYRDSAGKTKTSFALGASYIANPDGTVVDMYSPRLLADWRTQIYGGLNVQYNSWLIGATIRATYDENAIGVPTDGVMTGAGVSYDFLNFSASASYTFSKTGVWHNGANYDAHTGIMSLRYKYDANIDAWVSGGITIGEPFVGAGLRIKI